MRSRWAARVCGWVLVGVGIWGGTTCGAQADLSPNLKMGNPSGATTDVALKDNYLLDQQYFVTSYNNSKGTPNWVSWRLTKADLGKAPRDNFYADTELPAGFLEVEPQEYTGSGFDRGHMCPHGDRTATDAASLATFSMINIIPQSHNLNTKAWEALENYVRDLAQTQGKTCYIIDGPSGQGGVGKDGVEQSTPDGKVVVPSQNWKVVMVLDQDVATAKDLTADMKITLIAAIMPNDDSRVGESWTPFQTTVNAVEALTGYTFFSEVDPAVINPLKQQTTPAAEPDLLPLRGRIEPFAANPPVPPLPAPQVPARVRPESRSPQQEEPKEPPMPAFTALQQAVAGLTYPSETNEPFEVVTWGEAQGPLTDAKLWHLTGQNPKARLERVPLDQFFGRLTHPKRPRGQVTPELARRFETLLKTLKTELTDVEVIRFGQSEVAIYIIGRTREGKLIAIRTAATET